jgi:hypothetical protein
VVVAGSAGACGRRDRERFSSVRAEVGVPV